MSAETPTTLTGWREFLDAFVREHNGYPLVQRRVGSGPHWFSQPAILTGISHHATEECHGLHAGASVAFPLDLNAVMVSLSDLRIYTPPTDTEADQ